jgi:hypothetical protein
MQVRNIAFENVQIGAADGGFRNLDDGVGEGLDFRNGALLQRPMIDESLHWRRLFSGIVRSRSA